MGALKLKYYEESSGLEPSPLFLEKGLRKKGCAEKNCQDYYPFSSHMPGRSFSSGNQYKYGFNGMEKDDEVKGSGNSYDFGARIYDSRIGRFLSIDAKTNEQPAKTPYHFVSNDPISRVDPDGNTDFKYTVSYRNNSDGTKTKVINATAIYYVVNLTKGYYSSSTLPTTMASKSFDVSFAPSSVTGTKNPLHADNSEISKVEFNYTVQTKELAPENYSDLPDDANVIFIVDGVKGSGDGGAHAWATRGGQAIVTRKGSSFSGNIMTHEMGHNFGLLFPDNPTDDGHSKVKGAFMFSGSSGGFGDNNSVGETISRIFEMQLQNYQAEGTYSFGNNNAQENGRKLLKDKATDYDEKKYNDAAY